MQRTDAHPVPSQDEHPHNALSALSAMRSSALSQTVAYRDFQAQIVASWGVVSQKILAVASVSCMHAASHAAKSVSLASALLVVAIALKPARALDSKYEVALL